MWSKRQRAKREGTGVYSHRMVFAEALPSARTLKMTASSMLPWDSNSSEAQP